MTAEPGTTRILSFTDTALLGSGVARTEGLAVFCPGAIAGDTAEIRIVSVKKRYAEAELLRIITPSPDRIRPDCGAFGKCGGCAFRHLTYEAEAQLKEHAVHTALRPFSEILWDPIYTDSPNCYRNKTVFHLDEHYNAGYFAAATNTHMPLPNGQCALIPALFTRIAQATTRILTDIGTALPFRALAIRQNVLGSFTAVLHTVSPTGDLESTAVRWAKALADLFPEMSGFFLAHGMPEERTVRYKRLLGADHLTDEFLGLQLRISPAAFYQVNHNVAEAMCKTIARYADLKAGENAADLYCGTGTIGLTLAALSPNASVTGIEINEAAVRDAIANAEANGLTNIRFRCGDSATAERDGLHFDCVIIDPPRKGCSPQMLEALVRLDPQRIVYVSCNPATLARDASALAEQGWKIVRAQPFDMFPRTAHCETVVLLKKE